MAETNAVNYADALAIFYAKEIVEYPKKLGMLWMADEIKVDTESWNGSKFYVPIVIRYGQSAGARPEFGVLPNADPDETTHAEIFARQNYVSVQITGLVKALASNDQTSWEKVDEKTMQRSKETFFETMSRQMWTGTYGILAEAKSVALLGGTQYTVTIKQYADSIANPSGFAPRKAGKYLRPKMRVVYGASTGGVDFAATSSTGRGMGTIISVVTISPFSTFVIDIGGSGSIPAAADVFVLGDGLAAGSHSYGVEIAGIQQTVCASGDNFENVNTTTYPEWAGLVGGNPSGVGNGMFTPDENRIEEMADNIKWNSNGGGISCMATTPSCVRTLTQIIRNKGGERYEPCKFVGGKKALMWYIAGQDTPIIDDPMAPENDIYMPTLDALVRYQNLKFEWDTSGGAVWKWQAGRDAVVAFGKTYGNFGTERRNAHACLRDVFAPGNLAY